MNQENLPKVKKKDELFLQLFLLILCVSPLIISLFLKTDGKSTAFWFQKEIHGIGVPCPFKLVTDHNCPTCGSTRSFTFMSDLDIKSAWSMNKGAVLLYVFLILQIPIRLLRIFRNEIPYKKAIEMFEKVSLIIIVLLFIYGFVAQFFPALFHF